MPNLNEKISVQLQIFFTSGANSEIFCFHKVFIQYSFSQFISFHIIPVATVMLPFAEQKIEVINEHLHYTFLDWKSTEYPTECLGEFPKETKFSKLKQ